VHAPFGSAMTAIEILEGYDAIDSGIGDAGSGLTPWDEAAPCSSALGLPVLASNNSSFSQFWNLPLLSRSGGTTFPVGLSRSSGPYKGMLGLPLISRKAAPLSSMLGLPLLTKSRARHAAR
jgi:hypothetical protein